MRMRQARAVEHAQLQRAAPHVHVGALRMPCIGLGDLDAQCAENGAHVRQRGLCACAAGGDGVLVCQKSDTSAPKSQRLFIFL